MIIELLLIIAILIVALLIRQTAVYGGRYPWIREFIKPEKLRKLYTELRTAMPRVDARNARVSMQPLVLRDPERLVAQMAMCADSLRFEVLVDYFQEEARSKCRRVGLPSPWEAYQTLVARGRKNPSAVELRRIYKADCDQFPANIMTWIFKQFGRPEKLLMMCGGWGGEIIATMTHDVPRLVAVDPNAEAVAGWERMMDFYGRKKYKFIVSAFEDADLGDEKFDMMYTSPPYFTSEQYSASEEQSYRRYPERDAWIDKFMRPYLEKVWKHLLPNGHVVLVMNDTWQGDKVVHVTQDVHDIMDALPGSKFVGTWACKKAEHKKNYQPVFVWVKIKLV